MRFLFKKLEVLSPVGGKISANQKLCISRGEAQKKVKLLRLLRGSRAFTALQQQFSVTAEMLRSRSSSAAAVLLGGEASSVAGGDRERCSAFPQDSHGIRN